MTYLIPSLTSNGVASRIHRWIASGVAGRIPPWIASGLGRGLICGIVCGLICGIVCGITQIFWWIIGSVVRVTHALFNPTISH